ncbi:MAG: radical SAM protein [Treponema sp.]|nr:radical SAM protein [Treponema sp.]
MSFIPSDYYASCTQCPRSCGINRLLGEKGFCRETSDLRIALAGLHFGEEPLITVHGGSGTIFFTGCTLRCSFCQNYQISQHGMGSKVSMANFVRMCLLLQKHGAENINLVTGSHHIPLIAQYLKVAKKCGLTIPVAWNSSAYESTEMLSLLDGLVDIWLPDFKTLNSELSKKLFGAEDYPEVAKRAVEWMIEHSPLKIRELKIDGKDYEKIESGVIIRHLFLPGRFEDTVAALDWLKEHADTKACISLMSQYTPVPFTGSKEDLETRNRSLSSIENRLVTKEEDADLQDIIEAYDFDWLFYQELSDDTDWLPDFNLCQPFSNKLALPLWHWREGFIQNLTEGN